MRTETIWGDFKNELLGFIKARVKDDDLANDILQEVFIKIHLKINQLKDKDKLSSWVYSISRNTIIDYFRKQKREGFISNSESDLIQELEISQKDFSSCLKSFIPALSTKDQDALLKTSFEGLSQKEYAEQINLSYSATKSRVQRARERLKELFVACCQVETDQYGNVIASKEEECNC